MNEVDAQQARRIIDRLIGFKLSPCLWKHIDTHVIGLSAGRVQSSLLNMILEKEEELDNYEGDATVLQEVREKIASVEELQKPTEKETIYEDIDVDFEGMNEVYDELFEEELEDE